MKLHKGWMGKLGRSHLYVSKSQVFCTCVAHFVHIIRQRSSIEQAWDLMVVSGWGAAVRWKSKEMDNGGSCKRFSISVQFTSCQKKKKKFLRKEYATLFLYSAFVARHQAGSQAKPDTDRASRKGQRHHRKTPDVAGAAHD